MMGKIFLSLFLILCSSISTASATDLKEDEAVVLIQSDREDMDQAMKTLLDNIPNGKVGYIYEHVFDGFSFHLPKKHISKLQGIDTVVRVFENATYQISTTNNINYIGAEKARSFFDKQGHRLSGQGVKVAIIDTGIDYRHRDLSRSYRGGYDFIDGDNNPMETISLGKLNTVHGTHVAGIVAGNGKLRGVAPEAEIYAYRALGPGGRGTSEQVIAAIDKAVEDGMDIINLSLGNPINGPDWPTSLALNKATEKGVVAITSSGNSGPGIWTVGSPGTASKAISVGASFSPILIPTIVVLPDKLNIQMDLLQDSLPWRLDRDYEIVHRGLGTVKDMNDVAGKIVLVERGIIPFTEKAKNAENEGAKAVIIYNNSSGVFKGAITESISIPVVSISREDGLQLEKALRKGKAWVETRYEMIEDEIAKFSSRGPVTHSWAIKPDLVAPGVHINSTVPNGYEALDGTSMSAPHVAGAAAIIKQAHPTWSPQQLKAALMNTSKQLIDGNGDVYPTYVQGAGRIRIKEAVTTNLLIYPSALQFGKMNKKDLQVKRNLKLTIENVSEKSQKVTFDIPRHKKGVNWHVPLSFKMAPNEKKTVNVTLNVASAKLQNGLHDGFISVHVGDQKINLPYLFVINEPNYPRLSSFSFAKEKDTYLYEVYLPRGADEFGIALFDPDTLSYIRMLDYKKNVERGLIEGKLTKQMVGQSGYYRAMIFAKKAGKEDMLEVNLTIEK